jgi:hypothetical protein
MVPVVFHFLGTSGSPVSALVFYSLSFVCLLVSGRGLSSRTRSAFTISAVLIFISIDDYYCRYLVQIKTITYSFNKLNHPVAAQTRFSINYHLSRYYVMSAFFVNRKNENIFRCLRRWQQGAARRAALALRL